MKSCKRQGYQQRMHESLEEKLVTRGEMVRLKSVNLRVFRQRIKTMNELHALGHAH